MLRDLLAAIGESSGDLEIEIAWAPTESANGETLRSAFGAHTLVMQAGSNLGDRLSMAFSERFFFHRTQKVIAIGVDDPRLSREIVDHAFGLLESCEWVIGPAKDAAMDSAASSAPSSARIRARTRRCKTRAAFIRFSSGISAAICPRW